MGGLISMLMKISRLIEKDWEKNENKLKNLKKIEKTVLDGNLPRF